MLAKESATKDKLIVYLKGGILPLTLQDIQDRLANIGYVENLEPVERPLYGMKVMNNVRSGIIQCVQIEPTAVLRTYYMAQPHPNCRIYIENYDEGISMFMVCSEQNKYINEFAKLVEV